MNVKCIQLPVLPKTIAWLCHLMSESTQNAANLQNIIC
jgi:hypothetical protein